MKVYLQASLPDAASALPEAPKLTAAEQARRIILTVVVMVVFAAIFIAACSALAYWLITDIASFFATLLVVWLIYGAGIVLFHLAEIAGSFVDEVLTSKASPEAEGTPAPKAASERPVNGDQTC
jgi:hypothetical protein